MTSRGMRYWSSGSIPLIAPEILGDIIATASDVSVVTDPEANVLSVLVNPNHSYFGRLDHWEGQNLRDLLTEESVAKLERLLGRLADGHRIATPVELNHTDPVTHEFPVSYTMHTVGPEGALLLLGRDMRPIAEMQQQLVRAQLMLEKDYEVQREYDTRFRVLMQSTRDAMVFVSLGSGRVTEANKPAAQAMGMSRDDLVGAAFAQEFESRRRAEFLDTLQSAAAEDGPGSVELQARRTGRRLILTPSLFRASGERLILCRIDTADAADTVADDLTDDLGALYEEGVDAIVFTNEQGVIQAANVSFLGLVDVAHLTRARGRSMAEFLSRGQVDLKVLLENASDAGSVRLYATKLTSEFGAQIAGEISVTYLSHRTHPAFVFVIRDASRAEAARPAGLPGGVQTPVRSVMDLVGSATLKDIVAETTDVVEKMCIETAVELTRNNRVAAAEMLGLSRQSLYVKLRKYGLLEKGARD